MRGRTADALLAQVDDWHSALGGLRGVSHAPFKPSGHRSLDLQAGNEEAPFLWRFRELRSVPELVEEGRAQRHCVASYAASCINGRCSIWTMERVSRDGTEKRQTIEVTRDGLIVQVRGKANRYPTSSELEWLRKWAHHAGLYVSTHIRSDD